MDNLETLAACIITNVFLYHNKYMLSGCELIDTEYISLPSQNMKFGVESQTSYSVEQITYTYYDTGIHL
jgi:hypothetical protein